eukprot:3807307-Rhodomonas_salina.2
MHAATGITPGRARSIGKQQAQTSALLRSDLRKPTTPADAHTHTHTHMHIANTRAHNSGQQRADRLGRRRRLGAWGACGVRSCALC